MKGLFEEYSLERKLFYIGLAALPVGILFLGLYNTILSPLWPFSGCIWDILFGIYCPGCGGTRAVMALLQGKFLASLWYHPVVLYGVALYSIFMISQLLALLSRGRIRGIRFHNWYLYVSIVIIVVNCLAKNYLRIRHGITI